MPFSDKDEAQRLGAGFEYYKAGQRREGAPPGYCFIPPGELVAPFAKWRRIGNPFAPNPTEDPAHHPGREECRYGRTRLTRQPSRRTQGGQGAGGEPDPGGAVRHRTQGRGGEAGQSRRTAPTEPRPCEGYGSYTGPGLSPDDGLIVPGRQKVRGTFAANAAQGAKTVKT